MRNQEIFKMFSILTCVSDDVIHANKEIFKMFSILTCVSDDVIHANKFFEEELEPLVYSWRERFVLKPADPIVCVFEPIHKELERSDLKNMKLGIKNIDHNYVNEN